MLIGKAGTRGTLLKQEIFSGEFYNLLPSERTGGRIIP